MLALAATTWWESTDSFLLMSPEYKMGGGDSELPPRIGERAEQPSKPPFEGAHMLKSLTLPDSIMLNRILLATTIMVAVVPEKSLAQIQLGAKAGFAVANFVDDPDTEFESKVNFTGGFTFNSELNRNVSLQPEVLYVVKGAKTQAVIDEVPLNLSFSVTYIEVPLLLRYSMNPRSDITPVFLAGGAASWNINSRVKFGIVGGDTEFSDADDSIKALDFGVVVAAGVDIKWDLRRITLEARYTRGLTNLVDDQDDPKRNTAIAVTAGIRL